MRSGVVLGAAALLLYLAERRWPLRRATRPAAERTRQAGGLGVLAMGTMALVERPLTAALAAQAIRERRGLVQLLPAPAWVRDVAAVVLSDYAMYLWHVATHRVPVLWRLHLVHHIDLDLDTTTALRFHAVDMIVSAPVRALQVAVIGVSPRALMWSQGWFFASVLFHHSNLRLAAGLERRLAWLVTTPRMHGIHHSAVEGHTNSNWSSGISLWDRLHGTFRDDVPDAVTIGVAAYRDPSATGIVSSLALPFGHQRDAWAQKLTRPVTPK